MVLVQLYLANDIAREVVTALGDMSIMQFRDLNKKVSAFQRSFVKEIRRVETGQRQLRLLQSELDKENILAVPLVRDDQDADDIGYSSADISSRLSPGPSGSASISDNGSDIPIEELFELLDKYEDKFTQLRSASESLAKQEMEMIETKHVLLGGDRIVTGRVNLDLEEGGGGADHSDRQHLLQRRRSSLIFGDDGDEDSPDGFRQIGMEGSGLRRSSTFMGRDAPYVCGVIEQKHVSAFSRMLWRALRGNLYVDFNPIEEPLYDSHSGTKVKKTVFLVFTHGTELISKVRKIAEALDAHLYPVDRSSQLRKEHREHVESQLQDLEAVSKNTRRQIHSELGVVANRISRWSQALAREKAIYQTLNLFLYDPARKCLAAEGWLPADEVEDVRRALRMITENAGVEVPSILNVLHTNKTPPTFHRTNKLTYAFQNIVDVYAVATYQEVNPALPTIVTFPFMFAIMFGDLGHGFLLFLGALMFVLNEKKIGKMKREEMFDMAFSGRYVLLLMGIFSMYTGLLYNDVFSLSMSLFKSGWKWPESWNEGDSIVATQTGVYAFGLDSVWHGTENNLLFTNSYKMKLSILMGYTHMTYSYFFSLVNYLFYKSPIDIWGNFVPGLLFMQSIFGYLSLSIIYKWSVDWLKHGWQPPGLLNTLINMFLSPGTVDEPLYRGQSLVQVILVLIALVCVPWLLLLKPLYLRNQMKKREHYSPIESQDNGSGSSNTGDEDDDEEENAGHHESFGDIMIHQTIHTIEFCLNCVSHTASYLRLWALSLAHNQLSSVLWTMTLKSAFGMTGTLGVFMTVILFGLWFSLTVAILVLMEGTSAMLHSLRLHWVESMSKYFHGEGWAYEPFSLRQAEDEAAL